MENILQVFSNSSFGDLGILMIDEKPYFPATECAKILGYAKPHDAVSRHCNASVKHGVIDSMGRNQENNFIPEGDLYRLIVKSKLPSAEQFEKWVFDEVLPTIRKHGVYATSQKIEEMLADPDTMIITLQALKAEREKRIALEQKVEKDEPKVLFADSVESSSESILIGDMAKILKQNGVDTGQNRFFEYLRNNDYLCKFGDRKNTPTQRSMEMGLFQVKERTILDPSGNVKLAFTTKVTGKGQKYFVNKFLAS